jgi:hypothetical protein
MFHAKTQRHAETQRREGFELQAASYELRVAGSVFRRLPSTLCLSFAPLRVFAALRALLALFLFLFLSCAAAAQDSTFRQVRTIKGDVVDAAVDHLDNIYLISSTGQIKKVNAAGDSLAVYNQQKNYGQPHAIDVSNPLKILLFYKDFSTVVVLDRFLSVRATLDLKRFNILQPGAVGLSYDNNIWVFDEYDNKLKKIDEQGVSLQENTDLRNVFAEGLAPQKIINRNGLVYLADTAQGIFVFDNYGAFKKKLPLNRWQSFEVFRDDVVTIGSGSIYFYNPSNFIQRQYRLPSFQPYFHSVIGNGRLMILSKEGMDVYEIR